MAVKLSDRWLNEQVKKQPGPAAGALTFGTPTSRPSVEGGRRRPVAGSGAGDAVQANGDTPAANRLRFIMLTGCRPGEAMLATWDQFDAELGFWIKPSAHTTNLCGFPTIVSDQDKLGL
jgi:integrase